MSVFVKRLTIVLLSLVLFIKIKAQDTLVMNDGTEMYVKVVEIGPNQLCYKKHENINGPTYTTDLSRVFMAIYPGNRKEILRKADNSAETPAQEPEKPGKNINNPGIIATLHNRTFEVRLKEVNTLPDKKNKAISVNAAIEVYANGRMFTELFVNAYQRTDRVLDYTTPNSNYYTKSSIAISVVSEKLKSILFEKYENVAGKGYGWALPPKFFSLDQSACSVAFLEQKFANKELLSFGGVSANKIALQDCSSLENKLLSIALIWLQTNFT